MRAKNTVFIKSDFNFFKNKTADALLRLLFFIVKLFRNVPNITIVFLDGTVG